MYQPHPSAELNHLFRESPYQGVAPAEATFLFIGLDANYAPDIEAQPIFAKIVEYHKDGAAFWSRYGVHHPFLLPDYSGDGRLYHRTFARIGFTPAHAHLVSFVELLHRPTVGRSVLTTADLDPAHLQAVNAAVLHGRPRHVFIPAAVARLMRATGHFPWLPMSPTSNEGPLRVWMRQAGKTVYAHLHFSVYGKFEKQKSEELRAIGQLIGDARSVLEDVSMIKLGCANCGATLEITQDMDVFACSYCGSKQRVERRGGTVSLRRLEVAVEAVQRSTERMASELALTRLRHELNAVERRARKEQKDGASFGRFLMSVFVPMLLYGLLWDATWAVVLSVPVGLLGLIVFFGAASAESTEIERLQREIKAQKELLSAGDNRS